MMDDVAMVQEAVKAALEGFDGENVDLLLNDSLSEPLKDIFRNFSTNIVQTIAMCTADHDRVRVALARERALMRFHQMRQSVLPNLWKELFTKLSVPLPSPLLLQSINRQLLN